MYRIIKKGNKWIRKTVLAWYEVMYLLLVILGIVVFTTKIVQFYS